MDNDSENGDEINISEIYENALKDPTLLSSINVDELLDALENDNNSYLENKTLKIINKEVFDAISELGCDAERHADLYAKLMGFRLVNEICELHNGKYVKAVRRMRYDGKSPKITVFGTVANVKFNDNGMLVRVFRHVSSTKCMHMNYNFDNYITFQKLSEEEQLILMAYDSINENS
jgi:hypothetical protein